MTGTARISLFGSVLLAAIGFSACSDDSDNDGGAGGSDTGGSMTGGRGATQGGASATGGAARGGASGTGASAGAKASGGAAAGGAAAGGAATGGTATGGTATGGTSATSGAGGAAAGTRGAGAPGTGGTGTAGTTTASAGATLGAAGTLVTSGGAPVGTAGAPPIAGSAGTAGRIGIGGSFAGSAGMPATAGNAGTAGAAAAAFAQVWAFDTAEGWGIKASTVDTTRIDANAGTTLTFGLTPGVATWTVPFVTSANTAISQTAVENNFTAVDLTDRTITLKIRWVSGGIGVAAAATGGFDIYIVASDADLTDGASSYVGALALADRGTPEFRSFTYSVPPAAAPWEPAAVRQISIRIDSRFWTADPQPVFDYTTAVFELDSVTY